MENVILNKGKFEQRIYTPPLFDSMYCFYLANSLWVPVSAQLPYLKDSAKGAEISVL